MISAPLFRDTVITQKQPIAGLLYFRNYIEQSQADVLISKIDNALWLTDFKRRVQHYGYRYDYKARSTAGNAKLGVLPEWLSEICTSLYKDKFFAHTPDQIIINEYQPGQGIASHIDCIPCFEATIASLSLNSTCVMDFIHRMTHEKVSLLLEPRSLLVLSGDARYEWQHGIAHRKIDRHNGEFLKRERRLSLTFRNIVVS